MSSHSALRWVIGPLLLLGPSPHSWGDDKKDDFLATALQREIIGPRQTLAETADYCDAAVPRMPEVKTVEEWRTHADRMRSGVLERVIFRGEAAAWRDARTRVEWLETIGGGPGYRIKKLRFEALPGLWIPALLYEPEKLAGKVPAVLNVNGHDGKGKAADYKQVRCINEAKRGMLGLNIEWFGMGQFRDGNYRHDLINHIDLCGAGGIATHYLAMSRAIDLLLALEHTDPKRIAVTGLSGGGWQTIFISAFDTRVSLTDPVAGYSSFRTRVKHFSDLGDSEQTPCDLATVTDYGPMTAMMAPRATLLTFNAKDDCCFAADHALPPLLEAAGPIFKLYGKEANLRSHVNHDPGTHNYQIDNRQALYRMLGDHFYPDDQTFDPKEFPSDKEVKTEKELDVPLPADNASLHSLALSLSRNLPRNAQLPRDKDRAQAWRDERRERLRSIVHAKPFEVQAEKLRVEEKDGLTVTHWRLKMGPTWSVPVVAVTRGTPRTMTVLVGDSGRKGLAGEVKEWLGKDVGVLVVDPFYVGEAKPTDHDYLWPLMLATVGDRPLGLQASELAAVARWARREGKGTPITLAAHGRRASVMALVAAGLEPAAIDRVEVSAPLGSFKELIEAKTSYTEAPELFCFGLLADFDVAQLAALVAPRPLVVHQPGERARKELAGLKAWYATWGIEHEPLR